MATPFAAAAPRLNAPISLVDELELAGIYRERYPWLLTRAKSALGGELEHYAGKVAQRAMLEVWPRRAEFSAPGAFEDALHEAVRNEAAVQRHKHAAFHQRGAAPVPHVKPLSTDDAVAHLVATLHEAPLDHEAALAAARDASKHHAAEHVQQVGKERSWKGVAAVMVLIAIAVVLASSRITGAGGESAVRKALAADDARSHSAARGQRGNVELADGTQARIGSESRIRMPKAFGTTMRTAQVDGTASFSVADGQAQPFTVWAGDAIITATGTRFTVRAFPDEPWVLVSVHDGTVSVRVKNASELTDLSAGQTVRVTADGKVSALDAAKRDDAMAWVRDSLVFTDAPASTVLTELTRWFALSATLADSTLGSRAVTMRVGMQSSGDATAAFAKAAGFTIGFDDKGMMLFLAAPVPVSPQP